MDGAILATLSRQSGLMREMQVLANNVANMATTGYRQEGVLFSEFIRADGVEGDLAMTTARVGDTSPQQGVLKQTRAPFDLAVEGEGFFLVDTDRGPRLTRSGAFTPNGFGDLVTAQGFRVLDAGGAPIFIPPDARGVAVAPDGTVTAGDNLLGQIGLVTPAEGGRMTREDGVMFHAEDGFDPLPEARVLQGFLEASNVDPMGQMARMIEIQRAYEMGQSFLDLEDRRIRDAIDTFVR